MNQLFCFDSSQQRNATIAYCQLKEARLWNAFAKFPEADVMWLRITTLPTEDTSLIRPLKLMP